MTTRRRSPLSLLALERRDVPAVYTVNTLGDATTAGTLRWAIGQANSVTPNTADTINFAVAGTITLTSALPTITDSVTIAGNVASQVVVNGANAFRVFQSGDTTNATPSTTITNLTVRGGSATATGGGGLYVLKGSAALSNVTFDANLSTVAVSGAAVLFAGTTGSLTVTDCKFTGNGAGTSTTTFAVTGGAIATTATAPTVTITRSTFTGNLTGNGSGGALSFAGTGATPLVLIVDSTFSSNTAGGSGGAINTSLTTATINITNSLFANNAAGSVSTTQLGGAARLSGSVTVINSTFTANVAGPNGAGGQQGGGLALTTATATISNSTIVDNQAGTTGTGSGGGIYVSGPGKLSLRSTVLAGNFAGTFMAGTDLYRVITSGATLEATNTLFGAGDDFNAVLTVDIANLKGTASSLLDPQLAPLANTGGPTQTRSPLATSPARDKGSNPLGLTTDARGAGFPRERPTGFPDIGAVEIAADTVPVAAIGTAPDRTTGGVAPYTFTVRYGDATAIKASSAQGNTAAVTVTGTSGPLTVTAAVIDTNTNGTPRAVTYTVTTPDGSFDPADNGTYTIALVGGQIENLGGQTAAAGPLASFRVAIGQTFVVTNTLDDGLVGSLRWAMNEAVNFPAADTITFQAGLTGTMLLTSGTLPTISDSLDLRGQGASITIDGQGGNVFVANGPGTLDVRISDLTVQNAGGIGGLGGVTTGVTGGTVLAIGDESVTLTRLKVQNNTYSGKGGAIATEGPGLTLAVADCTFTNNTSTVAESGYGSAIYVRGPSSSVAIAGTLFAGNGNAQFGGAVYVGDTSDTLTVTGSLFQGSTARFGGALNASGQVAISNSTFSGNTIANGSATPQSFGSAATFGVATVTITSSTFTGNASNGTASPTLSGGAIYGTQNSLITISSSIVAGNTSKTQGPDIGTAAGTQSVTVTDSVIGVAGTGSGFAFRTGSGNNATGTVANPLDPQLAPLASNGGPLQTHALNGGVLNPARDLGPATSPLAFDQRGAPFARVSGGKLDAGAFEVQQLAKFGTLTVNDGQTQRSTVSKIAVTFTEALTTAPGSLAAGFTLQPLGGGTAVVPTYALTNGGKTVELTFPGLPGGTLANGYYQLVVNGTNLSSAAGAVDADNNGTAGGSVTLGTGGTLFRNLADFDGDTAVDGNDLAVFATAFNSVVGDANYRTYLDLDNDGAVDGNDLAVFAQRFNTVL